MASAALRLDGFVVVPCIPEDKLSEVEEQYFATLRSFPELKPGSFTDGKPKYTPAKTKRGKPQVVPETKQTLVLGGFGALGNPASFHNEFVRAARQWATRAVVDSGVWGPFLTKTGSAKTGSASPSKRPRVDDDDDTKKSTDDETQETQEEEEQQSGKFEQFIDRLLFRPIGDQAGKGSWHRDSNEGMIADPTTEPGIEIYGGWMNLNKDRTQYFSCVPGTHVASASAAADKKGFSLFKDKEQQDAFRERAKLVEIPPGHLLIFYKHLVHEIYAPKFDYSVHRLFLGWRFFTPALVAKWKDEANREQYGYAPLIPDDVRRIQEQAVMPLNAGDMPPMFYDLHWVYSKVRKNLVRFSATFRAQCTETRTLAHGDDAGTSYQIVHHHMKSLTEYGLPLYPAYTAEDWSVLRPANEWPATLLLPGVFSPAS